MELWICGQLKGKWMESGSVWEFQGAFSNEKKAVKACRDESYFIFPAQLDEELPHESVVAPSSAKYPRCE